MKYQEISRFFQKNHKKRHFFANFVLTNIPTEAYPIIQGLLLCISRKPGPALLFGLIRSRRGTGTEPTLHV